MTLAEALPLPPRVRAEQRQRCISFAKRIPTARAEGLSPDQIAREAPDYGVTVARDGTGWRISGGTISIGADSVAGCIEFWRLTYSDIWA